MSVNRKPAGGEGYSPDYRQVVELMREMGSKHGFDPMPPSQYEWMMAPDQPRLFRLMGWMYSKTIARGHRSAYAVDKDGNELHIEHLNADLEFEADGDKHGYANAREVFDEAVDLGLVRKGTKEDGRRRLYLCGEVIRQKLFEKVPGEEKAQPGLYKSFPSYILFEINKWSEPRRKEFIVRFEALKSAQKDAHAELMEVFREAVDQQEDTFFREWGLEKKRYPPRAEEGDPDEIAARQRRLDGLAEHVLRFVQNRNESVQGAEEISHESENGSVQSDSGGPTLLCSEITEITEIPSVGRSETIRERSTDRPDNGLTETEEQVRKWLLDTFPQIPTVLDLPLLRRLASTITTDEEFAHFQASARAINNPRKWVVFDMAWNRDRQRPNFRTAVANGGSGDPHFDAALALMKSWNGKDGKP